MFGICRPEVTAKNDNLAAPGKSAASDVPQRGLKFVKVPPVNQCCLVHHQKFGSLEELAQVALGADGEATLLGRVQAHLFKLFSKLNLRSKSSTFILEWKVRPSGRRLAASPVVPIAKATAPPGSELLTPAKIASRVKVLPQPPLASTKSCSGRLLDTLSITKSKISFCSSVIRSSRFLDHV